LWLCEVTETALSGTRRNAMHQHGESRPRQTELLGTRPHTLGSQGLAPLAKWLSTGSSSAMPKSNPPRIAPSSLDSFGKSWEEPKFEDRKQTHESLVSGPRCSRGRCEILRRPHPLAACSSATPETEKRPEPPDDSMAGSVCPLPLLLQEGPKQPFYALSDVIPRRVKGRQEMRGVYSTHPCPKSKTEYDGQH
jgi:hypothetical protein